MAENAKHTLLVVDDEAEILYSLRALLRKEFDFHAAHSGYEALQFLQQHPVQVVMADQRMPGTTGVELLTRIHAEHPEAVRLLLTGYADIKAVIGAINEGHVYRYLTKPWNPDELLLVLREACAEYDQAAERRRLLVDLRAFLGRCLAPAQGPQEPGGPTTPDGPGVGGAAETATTEQLAEAARALLTRLDRVLR